jgi:hypothetical protein
MVELITIQDKKHPVRVSYYVLKHFKKETGKSIEDIKTDDYEAYEIIIRLALESGYKSKGETSPFKAEHMEDVLDECFFEFIDLMPKFFPQVSEDQLKNVKTGRKKK